MHSHSGMSRPRSASVRRPSKCLMATSTSAILTTTAEAICSAVRLRRAVAETACRRPTLAPAVPSPARPPAPQAPPAWSGTGWQPAPTPNASRTPSSARDHFSVSARTKGEGSVLGTWLPQALVPLFRSSALGVAVPKLGRSERSF